MDLLKAECSKSFTILYKLFSKLQNNDFVFGVYTISTMNIYSLQQYNVLIN